VAMQVEKWLEVLGSFSIQLPAMNVGLNG